MEGNRRVYINGSGYNGLAAAKRQLNWTGANATSAQPVVAKLVEGAARRYGLDPVLVQAVIHVESGGNPTAISPKGAQGLMQLMPATGQRFGVGNAFDAAANLNSGARYLRILLDHYGGDLVHSLAAYNAGEDAVDRAIVQGGDGLPPYGETRTYVGRVIAYYGRPGERPVGLHLSPLADAAKRVIRRETDSRGRVIFTNE
jgi:soluble lytic murein transglycosylase-like protein